MTFRRYVGHNLSDAADRGGCLAVHFRRMIYLEVQVGGLGQLLEQRAHRKSVGPIESWRVVRQKTCHQTPSHGRGH